MRQRIKGGCQSGRKAVTHNSKSDLPLAEAAASVAAPHNISKDKSQRGYYGNLISSVLSMCLFGHKLAPSPNKASQQKSMIAQ